MSANGPAVLAAAAGVGFGHAILPDHWVPLAVLGRARRYPLARIMRLSGLAGIAHVLVSMILGAIVIVIGLQFRSAVESAEDTIIGVILIVTGAGFAVLELTGHGHHHDHDHAHDHDHDHDHGHDHDHDHGQDHDHHHHDPDPPPGPDRRGRLGALAAVMVPFGAAASPDLTILPVFLAATTAGVGIAIGSLVIFAAVTIATIVGLTLVAARGGYQIRGQWLERWGNVLTAGVLVVIGALVLTGLI